MATALSQPSVSNVAVLALFACSGLPGLDIPSAEQHATAALLVWRSGPGLLPRGLHPLLRARGRVIEPDKPTADGSGLYNTLFSPLLTRRFLPWAAPLLRCCHVTMPTHHAFIWRATLLACGGSQFFACLRVYYRRFPPLCAFLRAALPPCPAFSRTTTFTLLFTTCHFPAVGFCGHRRTPNCLP